MARWFSKLLLLPILFVSFGVAAHHSRPVFYDMNALVELEGEITRVLWRHPHVRYWIQADESYGGALWELETTPPSLLERHGIGRDVLAAGTRVRVAGPPARYVEHAMEVSHVLLPDGREVLLHAGREPLWSQDTVERELQDFDEQAVLVAEGAAEGIFRVWSRDADNRPPFWLDAYPLTESARAAAAAWDAVAKTDTGCRPKGMPRIMDNLWPFEFVNEGDQIRLRIEEFDLVRVIRMRGVLGEASPTLLGQSVGSWEDGDLIVTTNSIDPESFGAAGIQLSRDAEIVERFSLSADERRLDYTMTVTDPVTFTEPVTQRSHWIWRPGEAIKPYDCVEAPESWTSPTRRGQQGAP